MEVFYVVGWYRNYVKAQAKRYARLPWVAQSTNLMSDKYIALVRRSRRMEGAALYGIFRSLVSLAASCEPEGVLIRRDGRAHDADSLSVKTFLPKPDIQWALPILCAEGLIATAQSAEEATCEVEASKPQQEMESEVTKPDELKRRRRPQIRGVSPPMSAPHTHVTERNVTELPPTPQGAAATPPDGATPPPKPLPRPAWAKGGPQ